MKVKVTRIFTFKSLIKEFSLVEYTYQIYSLCLERFKSYGYGERVAGQKLRIPFRGHKQSSVTAAWISTKLKKKQQQEAQRSTIVHTSTHFWNETRADNDLHVKHKHWLPGTCLP